MSCQVCYSLCTLLPFLCLPEHTCERVCSRVLLTIYNCFELNTQPPPPHHFYPSIFDRLVWTGFLCAVLRIMFHYMPHAPPTTKPGLIADASLCIRLSARFCSSSSPALLNGMAVTCAVCRPHGVQSSCWQLSSDKWVCVCLQSRLPHLLARSVRCESTALGGPSAN